jgi:hypothetical protein
VCYPNRVMHRWTHVALVLSLLLLAVTLAPSCGSSDNGGGGAGGGGGDIDGGNGVCDQCQFDIDCYTGLQCISGFCSLPDTNPNCSSGAGGGGDVGGGGGVPGDDSGSEGGIDAGPCPPGTVGYVQALATPSGFATTALAVNLTTSRLFAPMQDGSGKSAGIAVFDTTTNALTATIPAVTVDGGPVPPYAFDFLTAVDATHNVFYATRQGTAILDVFNGATNVYASTIDVAALDSRCSSTLGLRSIALDPARQLLYTACPASGLNVEVSVVNVAGTASLAGSVLLGDLQSAVGGLALDATNQKLYVVNGVPAFASAQPPQVLVDVIDTTNNTEVPGGQIVIGPANVVGSLGGYPTVVTTPIADAGGPDADAGGPTFVALEGAGAGFLYNFTPVNYEQAGPTDPAGYFWAIGTDSNASGTFLTGVQSATDGGVPLVLSESPFTLPAGATLQAVQSFVAGNVYSYLNGYSSGSGEGGAPVSYVVCVP